MDRDDLPGGSSASRDNNRIAERAVPLRNPLPVPDRRRHKPMTFDIEPISDGIMDEFDMEPYPGDDFDI